MVDTSLQRLSSQFTEKPRGWEDVKSVIKVIDFTLNGVFGDSEEVQNKEFVEGFVGVLRGGMVEEDFDGGVRGEGEGGREGGEEGGRRRREEGLKSVTVVVAVAAAVALVGFVLMKRRRRG